MKYIIMCGGRYERWETPRQLTEINGEPVVARTIRLLREAWVTDISISAEHPAFARFGVPMLRHNNDFKVPLYCKTEGCWVSAFYPAKEPACYLFGDTVFSPEAIRMITEAETDSIRFFASCPPFAQEYIKKHAEPFAFKVMDQKRFRAAVDFVKANIDTGIFERHPIAWELWQVINGWNVNDINYGSYDTINDYTCDIDSPGDAERIKRCVI